MSPDIHRAVALRQYLRMASPSSPVRFKGAMGVIFNEIMDDNPSTDARRNLSQIFEDALDDQRAVSEIEEKYNHLSKKYVKLTEMNMSMSDRNTRLETEIKELRLKLALERLKGVRFIKRIKKEKKREYIEREVDSYEHEWMRDVFRPRSDSQEERYKFPSAQEESEQEEDEDMDESPTETEDKLLKDPTHFSMTFPEAQDMPM